MKDPLDTELRAYEILGVPRDAGRDEINRAFARLIDEQPERLDELRNAWDRLRFADRRLQEDIWYYPEAGEPEVEAAGEHLSGEFDWEPAIPAFEIGVELTDLAEGRFRRDFGRLEFREVKVGHLDRYDGEPAEILPVVFDK